MPGFHEILSVSVWMIVAQRQASHFSAISWWKQDDIRIVVEQHAKLDFNFNQYAINVVHMYVLSLDLLKRCVKYRKQFSTIKMQASLTVVQIMKLNKKNCGISFTFVLLLKNWTTC